MMSPCCLKLAQKLLDEDKITMELIDRMVMRILKLKEKFKLFDNPYTYADTELENKLFLCRKHILKPDETATVTFTITDDILKFYNSDMQFASENGEFEAMVGNSSENLKTAVFSLVD